MRSVAMINALDANYNGQNFWIRCHQINILDKNKREKRKNLRVIMIDHNQNDLSHFISLCQSNNLKLSNITNYQKL